MLEGRPEAEAFADFFIDLNCIIKAKAIALKQQRKTKLPDALVAATSIYAGLPLLTADTGFNGIPDLDLILLSLA